MLKYIWWWCKFWVFFFPSTCKHFLLVSSAACKCTGSLLSIGNEHGMISYHLGYLRDAAWGKKNWSMCSLYLCAQKAKLSLLPADLCIHIPGKIDCSIVCTDSCSVKTPLNWWRPKWSQVTQKKREPQGEKAVCVFSYNK